MEYKCKGCTERKEGCWDSCESYQAVKAYKAQLKQQYSRSSYKGQWVNAPRTRFSRTVANWQRGFKK